MIRLGIQMVGVCSTMRLTFFYGWLAEAYGPLGSTSLRTIGWGTASMSTMRPTGLRFLTWRMLRTGETGATSIQARTGARAGAVRRALRNYYDSAGRFFVHP